MKGNLYIRNHGIIDKKMIKLLNARCNLAKKEKALLTMVIILLDISAILATIIVLYYCCSLKKIMK